MLNTGLIARMEHILDEYEAGRLSPEDVERALEFHIQGIEGITLSAVHRLRDLLYRLVVAHLSDGDEEFIDGEEVAEVLSDLRQFLRSLPGGTDA